MTEKEQNKNPTASPKEEKPETPLTEEQRQKRRKMLVYPLMGLLFAGSMWLIFAPSDKDKAEAQQGVGFNTEMPLPVEAGIIADKRTAYEQAKMEEKQKERRAQMNDLAALFALQTRHVLDDHDTVLQLNRVNGRARLHFALAKWASHFRTSFPLASFFSSDFNLRSSFLMSSSGGRSSGRIPRPKSIDRTLDV